MNDWFSIQEHDGTALVSLRGYLGSMGKTAEDFTRELNGAKRVEIFADIGGGDSRCALSVHDALEGRQVTATVTGRLYSAGVFALCSAGTIHAHPDASFLLHRPVNHVVGNSDQLRAEADVLDSLESRIAAIVARRTGHSAAEIEAIWNCGNRWMNATEAWEFGLVTGIIRRPPKPGKSPLPVTAPGQRQGESSELLFEFLRALGPVAVESRSQCLAELASWGAANVREVPHL